MGTISVLGPFILIVELLNYEIAFSFQSIVDTEQFVSVGRLECKDITQVYYVF